MKKYQTISLIVLLGFFLRLLAFPFAQVVDADATTRVLIAESWLQSPSLIYEGVWPPLHFYFNALAIAVSGERLVMPILFHIIIGSATAYPFISSPSESLMRLVHGFPLCCMYYAQSFSEIRFILCQECHMHSLLLWH